jgi:hypothetical protein
MKTQNWAFPWPVSLVGWGRPGHRSLFWGLGKSLVSSLLSLLHPRLSSVGMSIQRCPLPVSAHPHGPSPFLTQMLG